MKKIFQTTFGTQGNCFSACCASLFEESLEKWECTANWREDWREQLAKLLAEKGLQHIEINLCGGAYSDGTPLPTLGACLNDGQLYMLGVTSRNHLPHVVIGRYLKNETGESLMFEIVHDPLGDHEERPITVSSLILFCSKHA